MTDTHSGGKPNGSDARRMVRALGRILSGARKRRGLSQERLASLAGCVRTTVLDVEHGRRDVSYLNIRNWLSACDMTWERFGEELHAQDSLESRIVVYHGHVEDAVYARKLQPLEVLGATMRICRRAADKSLEEAADDSGLVRWQFREIQRGERSARLGTLRRILKALGVNWHDFFLLINRLDEISAAGGDRESSGRPA